jgi:1,4-alpha-glucan branching enzyme
MLATVRAHREPQGASAQVLNQAARELLLLQSSDWPFLVTTGQAKEYAVQRFTTHVDRFHALLESIDRGEPDTALAADLWEKDKLFPEMDFRWFQ